MMAFVIFEFRLGARQIATFCLGCAASALLLSPAPAWAQALPGFAASVDEARARLSLTDVQVERLTPIFERYIEAQMAILDEHGIEIGGEGRTRLRTLLALRRDLRAADEATLERLSSILTGEQLAAYRTVQDEQRERNRELLR